MADKLIPLCRLYQHESKRTGKPYLVGSLSYTTKLVGFQEETDDGQTVWQLYIEEKPPKGSTGSEGGKPPQQRSEREKPLRTVPQPPSSASSVAPDTGGIDGGDYPIRSRSRQQTTEEELPF